MNDSKVLLIVIDITATNDLDENDTASLFVLYGLFIF